MNREERHLVAYDPGLARREQRPTVQATAREMRSVGVGGIWQLALTGRRALGASESLSDSGAIKSPPCLAQASR
jgi:hypothetical protein